MNSTYLHELLQSYCDQPLFLKLNENRSTMCSIRRESTKTKVSLNRIFLNAPKKVLLALGKAIKKKEPVIPAAVKAFIYQRLRKIDYSSQLDPKVLESPGQVYDLKSLYNAINCEYFGGKLNLKITWFDEIFRDDKAQFVFGLYYDALKLIKINRAMDGHKFPEYVVRFVIYHEMLHFVSPTYVDDEEFIVRIIAISNFWKSNLKTFQAQSFGFKNTVRTYLIMMALCFVKLNRQKIDQAIVTSHTYRI